MKKPRWKRILLKLSGETLGGKGGFGINLEAIEYIAGEVKMACALGCEVAIVIGGGNFIRGEKLSRLGIERATADYMGMLGTVINSLALQAVLENKFGLETRVMTALKMEEVAEPFIRRRAIRHLEKGRIVIFAGGTGSPYFTTDTAAALRASEIKAEAILKATNVKGIYESDPKLNKRAKFLKEINPLEMVKRGLRVMDLTSVTLAMENKIRVIVFDVFKKGNLRKLLLGQKIGSEIKT
jgi:uridylate kinase